MKYFRANGKRELLAAGIMGLNTGLDTLAGVSYRPELTSMSPPKSSQTITGSNGEPAPEMPVRVQSPARQTSCRKCGGDGMEEIQSGPYWRKCSLCGGSGTMTETETKQLEAVREFNRTRLSDAAWAETERPARECITHHHACDCRERAFRDALAVAQDVMEAYAPSHILEEWHCRVEDLTGTAYPGGVTDGSGSRAL